MTNDQERDLKLPDPPSQTSPTPPLIFISHDSRDAELAEAFSKLLISVSAGVLKSFRSSDREGAQGIEYGVEWYPELMRNLESASDVVCLLTPRSLDRPWILYEAGVAKGKLGTPLYGVALGIPLSKANTGPFAQFQNCDDKEASLTKLVLQLLSRVPGSDPDREAVKMQVASFRKRIPAILGAADASADGVQLETPSETASIAELFEEIKAMFQDLPSRLESRASTPSRDPDMRPRLLHPGAVRDVLFSLRAPERDPIGLVLVAGMVAEGMPWLAEMLRECYRDAAHGDVEDALTRLESISSVAHTLSRSSPADSDPAVVDWYTWELPRLLQQYLHAMPRPTRPSTRKKPLKAKSDGDSA